MMKNIIVCFIMLVLLAACSQKQKEGWEKRAEKLTGGDETEVGKENLVSLSEENRHFLDLQVAKVQEKKITDVIEAPAIFKLHPDARITIKAPLQGWVRELPVLPGSQVKQHELLAVIENPNNLGQRLKVRAPIDGIVTERPADLNTWVDSGQPLLEVSDFRRLQVVADIYPDDQARVKIGQSLSVDQDGRTGSGTITYLSPMANEQTGAIEIRADMDNSDMHFKAGLPISARIIVGEKRGLVVPGSALLHEEDHFIVFIQKGEQFEKRLVETGVRSGAEVEIVEGIQVGEKVVISGAYQLKNIAFSGAAAEED